ncbi:MAG: protein kinase, partial [Acidobacteriota bacterium]
GVVYRAYDSELDRSVAIKSIRPDRLEDPRAVQRFRREVRALARVQHPYLVQIFEVIEDGGQEHVVMECVEGRTLAEALVEDAPLKIDRVMAILRDVLDGLAAVHGRGFVHRDLKAENVILAHDGYVKLLDFGLAKSLGDVGTEDSGTLAESAFTAPNAVLGTGYAMAPEQARGLAVDDRADLFAVGVLAYLLLTGVRPFQGATRTDLLARVCGERQVAVDALRPEVPAALSAWVDHLREKSPEDRPPSARAALEALLSLESEASPRRHDPGASGAPGEGVQLVEPSEASSEVPEVPPTRRGPRRWWPALVAVGVAALAWLGLPGKTRPPVVAVLELTNSSQRSELAWWGTAVAEGLNAELVNLPEVRVLRPGWVAESKSMLPTSASRDELVDLLGADFVVTGSFLPLDDRNDSVSLTVRAWRVGEVAGGFSQRVEVRRDSLWRQLDSIAEAVGRFMLGNRHAGGSALALEGSFPDAWSGAGQLYAAGVDRLRKFDVRGALEVLEEARALDPDSAVVWVAMADALQLQGKTAAAAEAILRALELLPETVSSRERDLTRARGHALSEEWSAAAAVYGRLFSAEPDNLDLGLRYGEVLRLAGKLEIARAVTEQVAALPLADIDPRVGLLRARVSYTGEEWQEMVRWSEDAGTKARVLDAPGVLAQALTYQAIAWSNVGEKAKAERAIDEASIITALEIGSLAHVEVVDVAAKTAGAGGENRLSAALYRQAEVAYRRLGNDRGRLRALVGLSVMASRAEELEEAGAFLEEAVKVAARVESRIQRAVVHFSQASHFLRVGELEKAGDLYVSLVETFRDLGRPGYQTLAIANLGEVRFAQGDLDTAKALFEEAQQMKIGAGQSDHYELLFLGKIALKRGAYQRAGDLLQRAYDGAERHKALQDRTEVQLAQAQLAVAVGDPDAARDLAQLALETAEGAGQSAEAKGARQFLDGLAQDSTAGAEDSL